MEFVNFLKFFFIAFIHLLSSNWDLLTDAQLMYFYLHGDNYKYFFLNTSDPLINELNCTSPENHTTFNSEIYTYTCFSQEWTLGFITLAIMFLPGALLSILLAYGRSKAQDKTNMWICILISPLLSISFPFLLILSKVSLSVLMKYVLHLDWRWKLWLSNSSRWYQIIDKNFIENTLFL